MNIRPWHDETTLPLPLLGAQHQHQFAQTEAAVYVPSEAAQACTELGAEPDVDLRFPLEPYFRRHAWLGPLMVALIGFVWLCADGYVANLP
jgi:hypothetical protein